MTFGATIDLDGLVKRYGNFKAADNVSLHVGAGEFVTLLGSSGSGKTTTLMMIAGFVLPDEGTIRIGGQDISRLPPERRNLGVVFQSYALFPHLNVFENIAFPLRLRRTPEGEIKKRVGEVLELVDLARFAHRRIAQLSGGQQQRVALARAIVFSPPVLLMDEPLGALDRKLRDQLQTEIKRIQRDLGVTVVYVTHDQEEALALSDRIAIMSHGRIEQLGTPDEVYEAPVTPFVASFLGESNFIRVRPLEMNGSTARTVSTNDNDCVMTGRLAAGANSASDLLAMVRPEAISIAGRGGSGENIAQGTVRSREFLGATVRLVVAASVGELTVRIPRLEIDTALDVGSTINLAWKADHTILFPTS